MDADDRTNVIEDTSLSLPLFLHEVSSLHQTCSDSVEEYSLSSEEGLPHGTRHTAWQRFASMFKPRRCFWLHQYRFDAFLHTHFPIIDAYSNGRSYAGGQPFLKDDLGSRLTTLDPLPSGAWPLNSYQIPRNEVPTSPSMSTPSLSPYQSMGSSSARSSLNTSPSVTNDVPRQSLLEESDDLFHIYFPPEQPATPCWTQRENEIPRRRFKVEQTKELETWLLNHSSDPYPHHEEKRRLAACTGLSIRQIESWLSRARSKKPTRNSRFHRCLSRTTSVLEEPSSQGLLQHSSLNVQAAGESVILESSSITLEPRSLGYCEAGTHVAPTKVNGERITSSFSALVNAVVLVQRLNRLRTSKLDKAACTPVKAIPLSLGDTLKTRSSGGVNME